MPIPARYSQTDVSKLVSQLRIRINPSPRRLKNRFGPPGKFRKLSQIVTGLLKYERIELNYVKADEARGYAERLISEAIRHGDCHTPTMELADYWIQEKQVIHKLFKVLAPRFQNNQFSYTKLYRAPKVFTQDPYPKSVLELRGNPFPPLVPDLNMNRNLIHNVLLEEAKKDYRAQKYAEMSEKLATTDLAPETAGNKAESDSPLASEAGASAQESEELAEKSASSAQESEELAEKSASSAQESEELAEKSASSGEEAKASAAEPVKSADEKSTSKSSVLKDSQEGPKSS